MSDQNNASEAPEQQPSAEKKAKPAIKPLPAHAGSPPESRIGERITFARNELTLSVEGFSRYSRNFDPPDNRGIPATTLLRYEKGDSLPGARELRILCQTLNVPSRWILFGELENAGKDQAEQQLLAAMDHYVRVKTSELRLESGQNLREIFDPYSESNRLKWIEEARRPAAKPDGDN